MEKNITFISAILILTATVFLSCENKNDTEITSLYSKDLHVLYGVNLKTELEYYDEGTVRLLAYWENTTQSELMFSDRWELENYNAKKDKWIIIRREWIKRDIGFAISPERCLKHIYYITDAYGGNIIEGRYRIKTAFSIDENEDYFVTAEFTVTRDKSLLKKSELDFDDLENSIEIPISIAPPQRANNKNIVNTPVHIYKNKNTCDTTIVISGDEQYKIAEGTGGQGIIMCSLMSDGENKYLIYSYSRENEKSIHISVCSTLI